VDIEATAKTEAKTSANATAGPSTAQTAKSAVCSAQDDTLI
jgi:hypothetical protein